MGPELKVGTLEMVLEAFTQVNMVTPQSTSKPSVGGEEVGKPGMNEWFWGMEQWDP